MQPAREINERKQRLQIEHVRALLAYLEAGEPADMKFDRPLHVIHEGRGSDSDEGAGGGSSLAG